MEEAVSNLSVDVLKTQRLASRASGTVLQLRQYKGAVQFGTCDLWFFSPTSIFSCPNMEIDMVFAK